MKRTTLLRAAMPRAFFVCLVALFAYLHSAAQDYNYVARSGVQLTQGTGTSLFLGDDELSQALPIGFNFEFFGQTKTQFHVSSNGYLSFNSGIGDGCCSGQPIPTGGSSFVDFIAFAWEDLDPSSGGQINFFTAGSAPDRKLVVNFSNVPHCCSGSNAVTAQIVLFEGSNIIEIHTVNMPSDGGPHTMGIQSFDGSEGLSVEGRNAQVWSAFDETVVFLPAISGANDLMLAAIDSPSLFCRGQQDIVVTVTNNGTNRIDSFDLYVAVDDSLLSHTFHQISLDTQSNQSSAVTYSLDTTGSFAPLNGTGTQVFIGDDQVSGALSIGFAFDFYGETFSSFYISSNGFISFADEGDGCCSGQSIPDPSSPNNLIAFAWADLNPSNGGTIEYFTTGSSPNRKLVVSFNGVPHFGASDGVFSQIVLFEGSNEIEIHTTNMVSDGGSHTMGIEDPTGLSALAVPGRNASDWSATNHYVRFSPDSSSAEVPISSIQLRPASFDFDSAREYTIKAWTSLPNGLPDTVNYNDTMSRVLSPAMQDTFTIGGTDPDFSSFQAAVDQLILSGVCAPVVFLVRNGSYDEQLVIPEIAGANSTNTIRFQSESGDSSLVSLIFNTSGSLPSTVVLNGADYIEFVRLSIIAAGSGAARAVELTEEAEYNRFIRCVLQGFPTSSTSTSFATVYSNSDARDSHNEFHFNRIVHGSTGIYFQGDNSFAVAVGTVINGNEFVNQYFRGLYLLNHAGPVVTGNTLISNSSYSSFHGFNLSQCLSGVRVEGNVIQNVQNGYGIYLFDCISNAGNPSLFTNNFVHVSGPSTAYGVYLNRNEHLLMAFNSINISSSNTSNGRALYISSGTDHTLFNNIFSNQGGGYAFYVGSVSAVSQSDYNLFYSTGTNLAHWSGTKSTLSELQSSSGKDANSYDFDPRFVSVNDLHVRSSQINASGIPVSGIAFDIDGEVRNSDFPDIGADEVVPPPIDAGLRMFVRPKIPVSAGYRAISVGLRNFGADTLNSVNINWLLNDSLLGTSAWNGSLLEGQSDTVILDTVLFSSAQTYSLMAYTEAPNGQPDTLNHNDTVKITELRTALSGVYTIGGTNPDFQTVIGAVDTMIQRGVAGAVTFRIRDGVYAGQIEISTVQGASFSTDVRFEGENGNASSVVIAANSADFGANFTLRLASASHITFDNITFQATGTNYARVIDIVNGSTHLIFENCHFNGTVATSSSDDYALVYSDFGVQAEFLRFDSCTFLNGSYGVTLSGSETGINTNSIRQVSLTNNEFIDQYYAGVYLENVQGATIRNNRVDISSDNFFVYGFYLYACHGGFSVEQNEINMEALGSGVYFEYCRADEFNPSFVRNNMISVDQTSAVTEFVFRGGFGGSSAGLYSGFDNLFVFVDHNSVRFSSTDDFSSAFYYAFADAVFVRNNSFMAEGGALAYYADFSLPLVSDNNNLYAEDGDLGFYVQYAIDLADWVAFTELDSSSISVDPGYLSATNLHTRSLFLNNRGTSSANVVEDFDGEIRNATSPDIGADEYTPPATDVGVTAILNPAVPLLAGSSAIQVALSNFGTDTINSVVIGWVFNGVLQSPDTFQLNLTAGAIDTLNLGQESFNDSTEYSMLAWSALPNFVIDSFPENDSSQVSGVKTALSGAYTVGGVQSDFADFSEAVDALHERGVSAEVTFNVRDGVYNEQLLISGFAGSDQNEVVFQSEALDASAVTIGYQAQPDSNFTIRLDNAQNVTFKHLTINSLDVNYSTAVSILGKTERVSFTECSIVAPITSTSSSTNAVIVCRPSNTREAVRFTKNEIWNGSTGILASANFNDVTKACIIDSNDFMNQYYRGVAVSNMENVEVRSNTFSSSSNFSAYNAIYLTSNNLAFQVIGNRIFNVQAGVGISVNFENFIDGLIANNFVQIGGVNSTTAIRVASSQQIRIVNNSIHNTSTDQFNSFGIRVSFGSGNVVLNNIVYNSGGGAALDYGSGTVSQSDYNLIYVEGANLANQSAIAYSTLSEWQAATLFDLNSLSVNPLFNSTTDLHTLLIDVNGAALPDTSVTHDIDGDLRDAAKPDIGADEFDPPLNDAALNALFSPNIPFPASDTLEVKVQILNAGLADITEVLINWSINDTAQLTKLFTDTLQSGDESDSIVLGSYVFQIGQPYYLKFWTSSPNGNDDENTKNDTLEFENRFAGLSGIYTIGGTAPDFPTFGAAVAALGVGGVAGKVTFNVRPGTYLEQIEIPSVLGTSELHDITFTSENGDSSSVALSFGSSNSTQNYTLSLNGSKHVNFENITIQSTGLTFGTVVKIGDNSSDIKISNCRVLGTAVTTTSSNHTLLYASNTGIHNLSIENSLFENGSYGIYYLGQQSTNLGMGLQILSNHFVNQYYRGIYCYYADAPQIRDNELQASIDYTNYNGIYTGYCDNGVRITENDVSVPSGGIGIYTYYCDGQAGVPVLIANNFVSVGGTGTAYASYIYRSYHIHLIHNNFNVYSTNSNAGRAIYYPSFGDITLLNNNIINSGGGYTIYDGFFGTLSASDFNNLYSTGANFAYFNGTRSDLSGWQAASGQDANSLTIDPQYASNTDLHVSEIALNEAASLYPAVSIDHDGDLRDQVAPDIGADEFDPSSTNDAGIFAVVSPQKPFAPDTQDVVVNLKNNGGDTLFTVDINWAVNGNAQTPYEWSGAILSGGSENVTIGQFVFNQLIEHEIVVWTDSPNGSVDERLFNDTAISEGLLPALAGVYTIGGFNPDFDSFGEAVNALDLGGVSADVTFNVRNGTYEEQILINKIEGAGASAGIVFQSSTGDSAAVVLRFSGSSSANYVLKLDGSDHVTFSGIKFQSQNSTYARLIDVSNAAHNNLFVNNIFAGIPTTFLSTLHAIIYSESTEDHANVFRSNLFNNGSYGIYFQGRSSGNEDDNVIEYNHFVDQFYQAIYLSYQDDPVINGNVITSNSNYSNRYSVYLYQCDRGLQVTGNDIQQSAGSAVYLSSCLSDFVNQGLIANNFIKLSSNTTSPFSAVNVSNSVFQNIGFNNILISGNAEQSSGLYLTNGGNVNIKNNIISNIASGYAINVQTPSTVLESDNNLFHYSGSHLGYHNTNIDDLNQWQTVSSNDQNSLSFDPGFYSNADLHVSSILLDRAGVSFAGVINDIDGQQRHPLLPDIGADEFSPPVTDVTITDLAEPVIPFVSGTHNLSVRFLNNGGNRVDSVTINWAVNGSIQTPVNFYGNVASGNFSPSIGLGSRLFPLGNAVDLMFWSESPNGLSDENPGNDTLKLFNVQSALLGDYTIGGVSPDFQNFTEAVSALNSGGVAGDVTFFVRNGVYNEQFVINNFVRPDTSVAVLFKSESGNNDQVSVVFTPSASANYLVKLNGCSNVAFEEMSFVPQSGTFGHAVLIEDDASNIRFSRCIFTGFTVLSALTNPALVYQGNFVGDNIVFEDNLFQNGSYGIYMSGASSSDLQTSVDITNNRFENQFYSSVYLRFQDAPVVSGNVFNAGQSATSAHIAVNLSYCDNAVNLTSNTINLPAGGRGMYLQYCDGTGSDPILVANNFVAVGAASTAFGIDFYRAFHVDLFYNSVNIYGSGSNLGRALSFSSFGSINARNNIFANSDGGYAVFAGSTASLSTSDFNNMYSSGSILAFYSGDRSNLAAWRSISGKDPNSISVDPQFVSDTDLHTREILLSGAGFPIAGVQIDIDGDPRHSTAPDIGADEFEPPAPNDAGIELITSPSTPFAAGLNDVLVNLKNHGLNTLATVNIHWEVDGVPQSTFEFTGSVSSGQTVPVLIGAYNFPANVPIDIRAWPDSPNAAIDTVSFNDTAQVLGLISGMSDTFTIGGSAPDFNTVNDAVNALIYRGVVDHVTFLIRDGIYTEQIEIPQIPGVGSTKTITFQSDAQDVSKVELNHVSSFTSNFTLHLRSADFLRFRHLTLSSSPTGSNSRIVYISEGANSNSFENCVFSGSTVATSSYHAALVYSASGDKNQFNSFSNNQFINGSIGLAEQSGSPSNLSQGLSVSNNLFVNQYYYGLFVYSAHSPELIGNRIEGVRHSSGTGILINESDNGIEIVRNIVQMSNGGTALSINSCFANNALIANNFFSVHGTVNSNGIYISNSFNFRFYYNTVNSASLNSAAVAFRLNSGSNHTALNNIWASTGGGLSLALSSGNELAQADKNDLYSNGVNLVSSAGVSHTSLNSWKQASGIDQNSLSVDPVFLSSTDLHIRQALLDSAAIPIVQVIDDIDQEPRNAQKPDIGADEFDNVQNDIGITAVISPVSDCGLSLSDLTVRIQNFGALPQSNFEVVYHLNGGAPVSETYSSSTINAGASAEFTFSSPIDLSAIGTYQINAYTVLSIDEDLSNDTLPIVLIESYPQMVYSLPQNDTVCRGVQTTLTATGGGTYRWNTGQTSSSIGVTPATSTIYSVTVTNTNGCIRTGQAEVHVLPLPPNPVVSSSGSTTICNGDTLVLTSSYNTSNSWNNGSEQQAINVTQAGSFFVTHTDANECSSKSATVEVIRVPDAFISFTGFGTICFGDSVILTANHASSYSWSNGETTRSILDQPNDTTVYSIEATNTLGCTYHDTVSINVVPQISPTGVSNMLPANLSTNVNLPIPFSWSPAVNATHYDLYIGLQSQGLPSTATVSNIGQISYLYTGALTFGETYLWQIVAKNSCLQTPGPVQLFTVRNLPDLVVNDVQTPITTFSGQQINVSWEVKNSGSFQTGSTQWFDAIYLSNDTTLDLAFDVYLGGVSNLTSLTSGQSYINTRQVTLPQGIAGNYYIFIHTDRYNAVLEGRNNNNIGFNRQQAMLVNLTPPPDLQVKSILAPNNFFSGSQINVSWSVVNDGTGETVQTNWTDRIYFSEDTVFSGSATLLKTVNHSGILEPDSSYTKTAVVNIPQNIFGTYFIYVQTDVFNNVYEHALEHNNGRQSNALSVILTPPPDLVVTSISAAETASNNESISLSFTISNLGGSAPVVSSWTDKIFISASPNYDLSSSATLASIGHHGAISPGQSYTVSHNVTIPATFSGHFYFYVRADANGQVDEYTNETNNTLRADTSVFILNPDMRVSSVVAPGTATSGQAIPITWVVENSGPGSLVSRVWTDKIYLSPTNTFDANTAIQVKQQTTTATLVSGASKSLHNTITIPNGLFGELYLIVQTDANNNVFEPGAENNNTTSSTLIQVSLQPSADLTPTAISGPDSTIAGSVIHISFDIANRGELALTSASWLDRVYLSSDEIFNQNGATLIGNYPRSQQLDTGQHYTQMITANLPTTTPGGLYYLHVLTDANGEIFEHTDETNNHLHSAPMFVQAYPPVDIEVTAFTGPDSANSGAPISLSWTVRNSGQAATIPVSWIDAVYLSNDTVWNPTSDRLLGENNHNSVLPVAASYQTAHSLNIPEGTSGQFYLIVVADYQDRNDDVNFGNNSRLMRTAGGQPISIDIALTPPPDLKILTFQTPTTATSGQPISINWSVVNDGNGSTKNGSWTDRIYLSTDFTIDQGDHLLRSIQHSGDLDTNESYLDITDVTIPVTFSGNGILLIKTDATNVEYEHLRENNNIASAAIVVTQPAPADLVVSQITAPASVLAGETITINWRVENTGSNPASGLMRDAVYISRDSVWDIGDVLFGIKPYQVNLAPLATINHGITAELSGVPVGDHFIIVRTDILNNIFENNDTNNTTVSTSSMEVDVEELVLGIPTSATLSNGVNLCYRIEIPDTLAGETMLVTLQGDSVNGANELYLRYGEVPSRVTYDFSHSAPFHGNQEVSVPVLNEGTYYLLVHGVNTQANTQSIRLLARILDFEIRIVNADQGGNNGSVTTLLTGSKFESDMNVKLFNGNTAIVANEIFYVDPTRVFATFNLKGAAVGEYDVIAEKLSGQTTRLNNGFEVVAGTKPDLALNVIKPSSTRPGRTLSMAVEFANVGNTDIVDPNILLKSVEGAPLAFTVSELNQNFTELNLELQEPGGPPGVIRPGVTGSVVVYVQATTGLGFILHLPDLDND